MPLLAGILDHRVEILVTWTRCLAKIALDFLRSKLRGGDGKTNIFLIGNFTFARPDSTNLIGHCHHSRMGLLPEILQISDKMSVAALVVTVRKVLV
jgi:hypothetical protein